MLAAAAMALSLMGHHATGAPVDQHKVVVGWDLHVHRDTFTGQTGCSLYRRDIRVSSHTVIFHLDDGVETTHAWFRIDGGPPRQVAEAFAEDEKNGVFPEPGW